MWRNFSEQRSCCDDLIPLTFRSRMQQPINNRSVQLVVQAQPGIREKQSIYKNMKIQQARQLIGLGMLQILIGILCIICQGVSLKMHANNFTLFFVGHGFWAGLLVSSKFIPNNYNIIHVAVAVALDLFLTTWLLSHKGPFNSRRGSNSLSLSLDWVVET